MPAPIPLAATRRLALAVALLVLLCALGVQALLPGDARAEGKERVAVPKALIGFDDGDTVRIRWPGRQAEEVRILGIDTPEVLHLDHDLPYAQPFGEVAAGFLRGCIAASDKVELLRSGTKDKYGRTLGYLYVDGKNYSLLVLGARLAYGPNPKWGDEGLPEQNKACLAAAKQAGPPPFEPPWYYRKRMREVSAFMKKQGTYPSCPPPAAKDEGK